MFSRLFLRSSSLVTRPLYTRASLPGAWRYTFRPFSTMPGDSCRLPLTHPQNRFPNYFLQDVSDASSLEKRKQMMESVFTSILERLEIFYIDPQSKSLERQGFFEQLDAVVCKMDPEAKVYLSGGNIRNLFGYVYEEIRFAQSSQKKTTDQILNGFVTKEFAFRDEKNGKIPKMAALGVGSDLDILIEFSPEFDAEKKHAVIDAVYQFINRVGKGAKASLIKRTLLPVPDVKEYGAQIERATLQGGSPLDWLAFPITPRSGSQLRMPPQLPDLADKILQGKLDFFPVTRAEDPEVTTARVFRSLIEVPYLQVTEESYVELERSVERLSQSSSNSEVLKKVSYVFDRTIQNIRLPEASNRFVVPIEGDTIAAILHKAVKSIPVSERKLPVLPEVLPQKWIEGRPLDHDPGNLRKNGLLVPVEIFIAQYTDNGILYHGTPNREAMLPMLRGSLVVSTNQKDRPQGYAAHGRGFYTTRNKQTASEYAGQTGPIIPFQVNRSPQLRVINLEKLERSELKKLADEAKLKNKDLHEYLSEEYDIDVIVGFEDFALIQNASAFRIERTIEQNAILFFVIACSIGSLELVKLSLSETTIPYKDLHEAFIGAARNGHKEIVEMLLKNGSISEYSRYSAIESADSGGHNKIVEILLKCEPISERLRGIAIVHAAGGGLKEIVDNLLTAGSISKENCGRALVRAARGGHTEIVDRLLQIRFDSDVFYGDALVDAAERGHTEIVEKLLTHVLFFWDYCGSAIKKAAIGGHKEIIEKLLKRRSISESDRGIAIGNAALEGHKEIVEILFKSGSISDSDRGIALVHATYNGRKEILEILLKSGPISEHDRGKAIVIAAREGRIETVAILLNSGSIPHESREKAIKEASIKGRKEIVKILRKSRTIIDNFRVALAKFNR